ASLLSSQPYVAPRNLTEQTLVTIWQKLLGVEQIGVHDNFFELGGHSLLATRLVSMIRKELDMEISIKNIFQFNTIEELANSIRVISLNQLKNDKEQITIIKI
ncbi:phosphopantetheine-binding protein, partial [Ascidiimonas sp. W6]|uniref:phosphopantetheine-binding protein n=1 Tax=Ascidiimonas meishanensis TaxID=3128903 RepID=UPI0030EF8915